MSSIMTNGRSGSLDHKHDKKWWKEAVVYQIYPASFKDSNGDGIGDIQGIISKLDYLKDLGVDVVWVCPFYKSPQKDMGYDISDYQSCDPQYGTNEDVDAMIKGCHDRGLKIIFDLVVNHTSDQHPWFLESKSSKTNPKRDWYIWRAPIGYTDEGKPIPPCNWRSHFGGSVWEWDQTTEEFYLHFFVKEQPDLNWELQEVRDEIYKNAVNYWFEKGIDGFRIDTVNMYSKNLAFESVPVTDPSTPWQRADLVMSNGPRLHEFLAEMNEKCFSKYDCMTVGECPATPDVKEIRKFVSAEAKSLSMVFQFEIAIIDHGHDYRHLARSWPLSELKSHLAFYQSLVDGNDSWATNYIGNHDQARPVSRYVSDSVEWRERGAKMLAIYLLTLTGTPYIYQGEEIGSINADMDYPLENYLDVDTINFLANYTAIHGSSDAVLEKCKIGCQKTARDHGRLPVHWDDSPEAGFTTGKPWMVIPERNKVINVAAQINDPDSVLSFYKEMLKFRKSHPDLMIYGKSELIDKDNEDTVQFWKRDGDKEALVVLNFTGKTLDFEAPEGLKLELTNVKGGGQGSLEPYEGRVYIK